MESVWSEELEDKLVDLWQEHECLYQVTTGSYRDRVTIGCRMRPVHRGSQLSIGGTKFYDFFPEHARLHNRRNITIAATRFFCFLFNLILPILPKANDKITQNLIRVPLKSRLHLL